MDSLAVKNAWLKDKPFFVICFQHCDDVGGNGLQVFFLLLLCRFFCIVHRLCSR